MKDYMGTMVNCGVVCEFVSQLFKQRCVTDDGLEQSGKSVVPPSVALSPRNNPYIGVGGNPRLTKKQLMNTIDEILTKYNWPARATSNDIELLDIEREIRFALPEDYKDFFSRYGGYETQIREEYIKLWDKENVLSLNQGYEIFENLARTIGIGDNGAGEFIGIEKMDDGVFRIILTPFIDLDKQYHIEIGKSFTDFLLKLDQGEKWFKDIEKNS